MNQADLGEALGSLIAVLREAKGWRLTARPGRVVVDYFDGARALEVPWSAEQHEKAMAGIRSPNTDHRTPNTDNRTPNADHRSPNTDNRSPTTDYRLPTSDPRHPIIDGIALSLAGDAIVLLRGPDPNRRVEDLARDGILSSLAARLLDASVALGRNVIVAGPWLPSVEIISALVGGAHRPAVIGDDGVPLPKAWVRANAVADIITYGADRVGCWSHDVDVVSRLMATSSGVVGWLDARRLERVLVRYEAAIDVRAPRAQAPLQVVAGVDLVVVLHGTGAPRLREVAEITMAADGYRPQLLFSTGLPPSPVALVPLAAPTFLDELAAAGFGVLADELRAVVPRVEPRNDDHARTVSRARAIASQLDDEVEEVALEAQRPRPARDSVQGRDPLGIREALRPQGRPDARSDPAVPEIPRAVVEALRHAPPPGWELDRLGDEHWVDDGAAGSNAEDAAMAATFGLAPPPRPAGYKGEAVSFAELLKRARDREPQSGDDIEPLPPPPPEET